MVFYDICTVYTGLWSHVVDIFADLQKAEPGGAVQGEGLNMMIISYIRNHLKMHIMICALFSLLFTMELILNGEMFYGLGLNTAGLNETTYSFGVFNYDKSIATKLIDPGIGYSDVCFALITEDRDLVTYPCRIDNRRLESDTGVPVLQNGQILTSGGFEASVLRDEDGNVRTIDDIEINGVMLKTQEKSR